MASFPYNPTRILSASASNGSVYIFQPSVSNPNNAQLLALNRSQTLNPSSLPYATLSPSLPFAKDASAAYTPAIDGNGNILVYAGTCSNGTQGAKFWQLNSSEMSQDGNAVWQENSLSTGGISGDTSLDGANYLASGVAFSSTTNATSQMYVFGGMCPISATSTANDWTQSANYSNIMLNVQSAQTSSISTSYQLSVSPSRGPPIAEAGFTMTPLTPTFSNSSNNETQSQNQNFVLLGGHTQTAFINMSQVALFSLPERSWTFLPVDPPASKPNTDLAARSTLVDSRSGHTALLTSDGKRVIVFGGWVGDITQSAEPQLAVLELGAGYGGNADWQWNIPRLSGSGLATGTSIYGHGAVMLPGDVMMMLGGYQIPTRSNSKRQRVNAAANANTYFFNTTSNTWIASYTPPVPLSGQDPTQGAATGSNLTATKAGLGAGLTMGILAIIIIVVAYFWYARRLKLRRDAREDKLRRLSAGAQRLQLSDTNSRRTDEMATVDWADDGNQTLNREHQWPSSRGNQAANLNNRGEPEAERTGLLFEIPSPTRGLRRSLHSRALYQPTPRFDDGRRGPGLSTIHPIDERDEYDEGAVQGGPSQDSETLHRRDYNLLSNVPMLNPFQDEGDESRSPSPQSPQERELEIRRWVSDWTAADALMHSQAAGRLSPEKTDRTSSTLSDQSARSMQSVSSIQRSLGSLSRTMSQRSAALFSTGPLRSTNETTPLNNQRGEHSIERPRSDHRRSQSLTMFPSTQRTDTFETAATSFPQLQAEGEALLGENAGSRPTSPTRVQSRARGWMGSMRRAFAGTERSASTSPEMGGSASSSSPTKYHHSDEAVPRRAASTGATMVWQKRQGAKDWDVENGGRRGEANGNHGRRGEDEWDVESAIERRVVQVMFTVPKEKLRVVNRDPETDSLMSAEVVDSVEGKMEGEETYRSTGKGKEKE